MLALLLFFNFNVYSGLLLPPFIHGIIFTFIFIRRYFIEDRKSDLFASLITLANTSKISFWMLGFAGWYDLYDWKTTCMFYLPFDWLFILGPLMYYYFSSLTDIHFKIRKSAWYHKVLFGIWGIFFAGKFLIDFIFFRPFEVSGDNMMGSKGPWSELNKNFSIEILSLLVFAAYLVMTYRQYLQYRKFVRENYSNSDQIEYGWIRNLLIALSIGILIIPFLNLLSYICNWQLSYIDNWNAYFGLGLVMYYFTLQAYHVKYIKTSHEVSLQPEATIEADNAEYEQNMEDIEALQAQISLYIDKQKPYLDPELSLSQLAIALRSNKNNVSKAINYSGKNFNDFINELRVNEIIFQLKKGRHKERTLLSIALDSGFNSKATFNRAFKKTTGFSPLTYLAENNL